MTVSTTANKASFDGSGSTGPFTFNFRFFNNTEITVVKTIDGDDTTLAETTDYTLTGAGSYAGGSVTLVAALESGESLTVYRTLPIQQLTDLRNQGSFFAETHEEVFDKLVMIAQQNSESIDRTLKVSVSTPSGVSTELPPPVANNVIGWDNTGAELRNFDSNEFATSVAYGTSQADVFTGDGSADEFDLSFDPANINNLDVSIGGVTQTPGIDYTWTSGTTVTFTTAPPNGTTILIRYMRGLAQGSVDWLAIVSRPFVDTQIYINTDTTISANVEVLDGGGYVVASGKTLTFTGNFSAGLYQVFSGSGSVVFSTGSVTEAYPEWFGITGTNDHVAINKALAATKRVLLSQKYTVASTGTSITMNNGNQLTGKGSAEIYTAAVPNGVANIYVVEIPAGADNCEISGIAFTGNGSTAAGTNYPSAIRVYKGNYANIHHNTFDGISWGVNITGDSYTVGTTGTKVTDNTFFDMTGPVADGGGYGILMAFNDSTVVSNNTFEGTSRHCIYLSAATKRANVANNICKGSTFAPISIYAGDVVNNEIYDCVIDGNQFIGLGTVLVNSHGIAIAGKVFNNIISDNIVKNSRDIGIMLQATSALRYPYNNIISNNTITGSQSWGISAIDVSGNTFTGNTITGNCADGTSIYETLFGRSVSSGIGYNKIIGNIITPTNAQVRYAVYIGANSNYNKVDSNSLTAGTLGILTDVSGTAQIAQDNAGLQTVAYGASVTIDPTLGEVATITLTGDITIGVDAVKKMKGQRLTLRIIQDGTGGRAVTLGTAFKNSWSNTGNTANKAQVASFICLDGVYFQQIGAATGWYTP